MNLVDMISRFKAAQLPSVMEYRSINNKELQYRLTRDQGVTMIPYKVSFFTSYSVLLFCYSTVKYQNLCSQVFHTFNASRGAAYQAAKDAFVCLKEELSEALEFVPFVEPNKYIIKPVVGACKAGFFDITVEDMESNGFMQSVKTHINSFPNVNKWIVQPFIPQFSKSEYKVFVGGKDKMVIYQPVYSDNQGSVMVYCHSDHIYSDVFGADNCSLETETNIATKTWFHPVLYSKIAMFADKCKSAFSGSVGMDSLDVLCRVDMVCLFKVCEEDEDQQQYDTDNPLIVFNEMDNFWSASLLVDMINPFRDSLRPPQVPGGTRDPVQVWWVNELCRLLTKYLLSHSTYKEINWGARPGTLGRKRKNTASIS